MKYVVYEWRDRKGDRGKIRCWMHVWKVRCVNIIALNLRGMWFEQPFVWQLMWQP